MPSCRLVSRLIPFLALLAGGLAIWGCGSGAPRSAAPGPAQLSSELRGSPAPLAALHAQANALLSGGTSAFTARLRELRGHPVVVNAWASWCEPCRSEFPVFQGVSGGFGRRVAFVGIDGKDPGSAPSAFLRSFPVSYPSYTDPDGTITSGVMYVAQYPQTAFYSRSGRRMYIHSGPYLKAAELRHDIQTYALR